MEVVLNQLSAIVPVYKDELHEALAAIIRRRRLSGLLGTAVLLLFASQLFTSIRARAERHLRVPRRARASCAACCGTW